VSAWEDRNRNQEAKLNTKRKLDEDDAEDGAGGAPIGRRLEIENLRLPDADLRGLREIAKFGGGGHFVAPREVGVSQLRRLREGGFVELLDTLDGKTSARLTARGLQALAAAPGVMAP
jgi:hypothetical protein